MWAQNTGSAVGTVINSISGAGVAGMNVLLWKPGAQYQATTDDSGTFRIDEIAPGSYRAGFEKEGFVPLQRDKDPIVVTSAAEPARACRDEPVRHAARAGGRRRRPARR